VLTRENELKAEEMRLEEVKRVLEDSAKKLQQQNAPTTTTERWLEGSVLGMQTEDKNTRLRQWGHECHGGKYFYGQSGQARVSHVFRRR